MNDWLFMLGACVVSGSLGWLAVDNYYLRKRIKILNSIVGILEKSQDAMVRVEKSLQEYERRNYKQDDNFND